NIRRVSNSPLRSVGDLPGYAGRCSCHRAFDSDRWASQVPCSSRPPGSEHRNAARPRNRPVDCRCVANRVHLISIDCFSRCAWGPSVKTVYFRSWSRDLVAGFGLGEKDVSLLRYRGMGNPGLTRVETRDGRAFAVTYNELWEDEGKWMLQFRCK